MFIQVITTADKKSVAEKIARMAVEQKLAACVQIAGPVKSVYRWKNKIERSTEWLCFIKTKESLYPKLEKLIKQNHSYSVPEIIALPICRGSKDYLTWLNQETK